MARQVPPLGPRARSRTSGSATQFEHLVHASNDPSPWQEALAADSLGKAASDYVDDLESDLRVSPMSAEIWKETGGCWRQCVGLLHPRDRRMTLILLLLLLLLLVFVVVVFVVFFFVVFVVLLLLLLLLFGVRVYTELFGLPFGLMSAVIQFNRVPCFIAACLRRLLLMLTSHYFDD